MILVRVSNVQALMDLPCQFVKFNANFVQRPTENPTMLNSLADMLHKMEKAIGAEGVETAQALAMIQKAGIDRVQGLYFAKPMKGDDFLALVGR